MAQLGKYQLVAEIARGGMGIVYLGVAQGPARFSKLLVVKELKPELVEDGPFLEMFLEEARLAARLSHPNIVQTYEIGAEGNRHFIVMDYLEGVTLARAIRRGSDKVTLPMQLRILSEILQGLDYAHTLEDFDGTPLGIVHRDVTPQNVFVTFDGTVKLVDFGIAKARDSTLETRTGTLKGKAPYMAPEQIAGDADPRADVFAVGVMIWEAVVGHRMWQNKREVEVLSAVIRGEVPSLRATKPDAPEPLIRMVERALAPDRNNRYASAAELQEDIEAYLALEAPQTSMRDVGRVIADLFAKERTTARSTIEQRVAALTSGKPPDTLAKLPATSNESSVTPSGSRSGPSLLADAPVTHPLPTASPSTSTLPGTLGASEMPSAASDALLRELAAKKQKTTIGIAIGAGAVLLVAVAAFRLAPRSTARDDAPSKNAVAGPEAPLAALSYDLNIQVSPPSALVSVDGVPLSNPGRRTCAAGQHIAMHASAPHYLSVARDLVCERDESLELALQPEPSAANQSPPAPTAAAAQWAPIGRRAPTPTPSHSAAAPPSAPSPPPGPTQVSPAGGTKPNRPIETDNPYGD